MAEECPRCGSGGYGCYECTPNLWEEGQRKIKPNLRAIISASAALLAQQQNPEAAILHDPDGYEFEPKNIDPLSKPKSKRARRRAEAKARAAKETGE